MARKKGEGHYSQDGEYHVWRLTYERDPVTQKRESKVIKRKSLKEVKRLVREYLRSVEDGGPRLTSGTMTSNQWSDLWLATVKNHREHKTWEGYESTYRLWLKPRIGNVRLDRLTTNHIQLAVDDAREAGHDRTAIYVLEIAKRMLNAARRQTPPLIAPTHNPCSGVIVPEPAPERDRILSHEEVDEAMTELYKEVPFKTKEGTWFPYRHRYLVTYALETGKREAEVCGLQIPQLNLHEGTARVAAQISRVGGKLTLKAYTKGRNIRTVPLTPAAIEAAKGHLALVAEDRKRAGDAYDDWGLVFASEEGTPVAPRNLIRTIERLQESINAQRKARGEEPREPWTFHDLRRTFGTRVAQGGANLKVAQKLLGHKKIATTAKIYVIAESDDLAAAVANMTNRKKAG